MFGRKTREIGVLEARVTRQMERIVEIEKVLNDATVLLAKKHGLVLRQPYALYYGTTYSPLVRLATSTKTKHIKL